MTKAGDKQNEIYRQMQYERAYKPTEYNKRGIGRKQREYTARTEYTFQRGYY